MVDVDALSRWIDLTGVFVFALSGASLAARKGFDAVGVLVLALVTGLGGGMVRDVLLASGPPVALREADYLLVPAVAAGIVLLVPRLVERLRRPVLVFDAMGLGLFAVTGTVRALGHDLDAGAAVLLGALTAVGGGIMRDVLASEVPLIFRADSRLYAVPAILGAAGVVVLWETGTYTTVAGFAVAGGVVAVRLLALRFRWGAPTPRDRRTPRAGSRR